MKIMISLLVCLYVSACTLWGDGGKMPSVIEEQEMLYKAKNIFETLEEESDGMEKSFEEEQKKKQAELAKQYETIMKTAKVKAEGFALALGKPQITGLGEPFIDISKTENRSILKDNVYILLEKLHKNKKNGTIHYYVGDTQFSRIPDVQQGDTIIIENGNLYVQNDITIPVGIIVLSDYYDIEENLKNNRGDGEGNLVIHPQVTQIDALIYASGGIMEQQGFSTQTDQLTLTINGSIFTKNTIGGVKEGASVCYFPGNIETSNCQAAREYDLNLLRRVAQGKYSVYIKNNSFFQGHLPKGF